MGIEYNFSTMHKTSLILTLTCLNRHIGAIGLRGQANNTLIEISAKQLQQWNASVFSGLMTFLKVELRLSQLTDLFATHYPHKQKNEQMELTYVFLSLFNNARVFIRASISPMLFVKSASNIFKSANWLEREIYDMFGILFTDHPDLRPILTDYGFQGHPLRKDFPMTGYTQIRYDYETKIIVSEPLKLTQEFRNFDFVSPWKASNINSF